jgi:hypothetical protein
MEDYFQIHLDFWDTIHVQPLWKDEMLLESAITKWNVSSSKSTFKSLKSLRGPLKESLGPKKSLLIRSLIGLKSNKRS